MPWVEPSITLRWGPYSKPDPEEQTAIVTLTQAALGGPGGKPLITKRAAVEKIADIFGIEDIDAALEALEKELAEADQKAADAALTEQQNLHALANGTKPGGPGGAGGAKSKAPPGGGSSGGSAPASKA